MMCGRHSSIRSRLSPVLALVLATGGWWIIAGAGAMAATTTPDSGAGATAGGGRAVAICCAWGSKLADGVLTYSVSSTDPTSASIIRNAVAAWDDALPDLRMTEVTKKPDIAITYGPGSADGGESPGGTGARGLTTTYLNGRHLVLRAEIGIDGGPTPVNAGAVEEIAKHELGHGPRPRPRQLGRRPHVAAGQPHAGTPPALRHQRRHPRQLLAHGQSRPPAQARSGDIVALLSAAGRPSLLALAVRLSARFVNRC